MTADVADTITEKFDALPSHWIVMIETDSESSSQVALETVKHLTEDGSEGIILEASRPCKNVLQQFDEHGIDTDDVFILDTLCKMQSSDPPSHDNVVHLDSASALTGISIAINKALDSTSGDRFLFIDSLSSFLIHNDEEVLIQFVHRVFNTLRMNDVNGVVMTVGSQTTEKARSSIAQLCDKVVQV